MHASCHDRTGTVVYTLYISRCGSKAPPVFYGLVLPNMSPRRRCQVAIGVSVRLTVPLDDTEAMKWPFGEIRALLIVPLPTLTERHLERCIRELAFHPVKRIVRSPPQPATRRMPSGEKETSHTGQSVSSAVLGAPVWESHVRTL